MKLKINVRENGWLRYSGKSSRDAIEKVRGSIAASFSHLLMIQVAFQYVDHCMTVTEWVWFGDCGFSVNCFGGLYGKESSAFIIHFN